MTRQRYVEQVFSRPSPQEDLRVQVSPAAFGAQVGQALVDTGQALGEVADVTAQIEALTNETLAREAAVKFSKAAADVLHGQDGYLQLTGTAALGRRGDYQRRIDELRGRLAQDLPAGARRVYDRLTEPRALAYYEHLVRHEADQLKVATNANLSAAVANSVEDAVRARADPALFQWHLDEALQSLDRFAELNGLPPEERDLKRRELVSSTYLQAIMATADEPGGAPVAAAMARRATDKLTVADRQKLDRILGPTLRRGEAAAFLERFARSPSAAYHSGGPRDGYTDAVARLLGEPFALPPGSPAVARAVYDEFVRLGLPHAVARALTAEAYRENRLNPNYMFGDHIDAKNMATNTGLFSWQGDRRERLLAWLRERGHIDEHGRIKQTRDALRAQVEFAVTELLSRPDADAFMGRLNEAKTDDELAELLGREYIKWAVDDPQYRERGLRAVRIGRELVDLANDPAMLGVEPTPENRFLIERFGASEGSAMITAEPGTPVESILGEAEAERRGLTGLTVGYVRRRVAELFGAPSAPVSSGRPFDYAAAARAIDGIQDPELRRLAWDELTARYRRDTFAREQERQDMLDSIWQRLVAGEEVKLTAAQQMLLGAEGVAAVNKLIERMREGPSTSDIRVYTQLRKMAFEEPEKFLLVDLLEHRSHGSLSDQDYRELHDLQLRLRAGKEAHQRERQADISAKAMLERVKAYATHKLKFNPLGTDKEDMKHSRKAELFLKEFTKLIEAESSQKQKREWTDLELMQLVDKLTMKVRTRQGEMEMYLADYQRRPGDIVELAPFTAEQFGATAIEAARAALAQIPLHSTVKKDDFLSQDVVVRHLNNIRRVREWLQHNPSPTKEDAFEFAPRLDIDPSMDLPEGLFAEVPPASLVQKLVDAAQSVFSSGSSDKQKYVYFDDSGQKVELQVPEGIERLKRYWVLFYLSVLRGGQVW
jgi:hypothetical protein